MALVRVVALTAVPVFRAPSTLSSRCYLGPSCFLFFGGGGGGGASVLLFFLSLKQGLNLGALHTSQ